VSTSGLGRPDEGVRTDKTSAKEKTKEKGKGKCLDTQQEPEQAKSKSKSKSKKSKSKGGELELEMAEHPHSDQEQESTSFGDPHLLVVEAPHERELDTITLDDDGSELRVEAIDRSPEEDRERPAQDQTEVSSSIIDLSSSSQVAPVDIEMDMDSVMEVVQDSESEVRSPSAAPPIRPAAAISEASIAIPDSTTRRHSTSNSIVASDSHSSPSARADSSSTLVGSNTCSSSLKRPAVQMVLSTAGASWSFLRDVADEPPRKKGRVPASDSLDTVTDGGKKGDGNRKLEGGVGKVQGGILKND
jgi:hypothetical protein